METDQETVMQLRNADFGLRNEKLKDLLIRNSQSKIRNEKQERVFEWQFRQSRA